MSEQQFSTNVIVCTDKARTGASFQASNSLLALRIRRLLSLESTGIVLYIIMPITLELSLLLLTAD
jgi:hypothetical protein